MDTEERDLAPLLGMGPSDSIAFVHGSSPQVAALSRLLRRVAGNVVLADHLDSISDYTPYALVAVHYDALTPEEQARIIEGFSYSLDRPALLLLSEKGAQRDFAALFGARALTNMLVINETSVDNSDLLVTVQKIRHREIFGLEKYFVWGIDPRVIQVTSSAQKADVLTTITEYATSIDVAPRLRSLIQIVADEFVTNAVYNAPVHPDGTRRYNSRSRTEVVELDPGEVIDVKFCCDGKRFALSVTDPFGSLSPGQIQGYLAKGYKGGPGQVTESTGGAGIGFYQIIDSLSHFVINIEPGRRTEMIGFVDVSGSYRTFATSGKSFNIFLKESGE